MSEAKKANGANQIPWRQRLTLRPFDVATVLGVSQAAVYASIKSGEIPTQQVAGAKRVPVFWLLAQETGWQQTAAQSQEGQA
jgi:predicted DNA-binding transcriptional regulator AlpA